jgi:hypothetical protein
MEGIGDDHGAAMDAGGTEVMQALEVTALALPVTDRVIHKVKLRYIAKVGDGKDGGEHRLQTGVVAFGGQLVHLEKALIGAALDLDEVRDTNSCRNLGKVETAAKGAVLVGHSLLLGPVSRGKERPTGSSGAPGYSVLPRNSRPASFGTGISLVVTAALKAWVQRRFLLRGRR